MEGVIASVTVCCVGGGVGGWLGLVSLAFQEPLVR